MELLCQQIGLDLSKDSISDTCFTVDALTKNLHDYKSNGPTIISWLRKPKPDATNNQLHFYNVGISTLEQLSKHNIITYTSQEGTDKITNEDITIYAYACTDRYRLEILNSELTWLMQPKTTRAEMPATKNFVYYNPSTGDASVNGNVVRFKPSKRNSSVRPKELFDLLFHSAPKRVPRKEIIKVLRLEPDSPDESDHISKAFTNLRKRCKVSSDVISMNNSGSLNAITVMVEKIPEDFKFTD